MSLTLHFHPLASFCHKVLIALYENDVAFVPHIVDLGDPSARQAFEKLWPLAKIPVLRDDARDCTVPESSVIIEYLDIHHAERRSLIPKDAELAWQCRLRDRFYDQYVDAPMQKIVTDKLRPEGEHDRYGVERARETLRTAYAVIEEWMRARTWAMGDSFTMADCAAAPALFYAEKVEPFGDAHPNVAAYLSRLAQRPSFARVLEEAKPYWALFPG
jgi:glutathione S-transferase